MPEWVRTGSRGAIANQLESFAMVAIERGDPDRAGRLFGAAEALREAARAAMLPFERVEYDAVVERLRSGPDGRIVERGLGGGADDVDRRRCGVRAPRLRDWLGSQQTGMLGR